MEPPPKPSRMKGKARANNRGQATGSKVVVLWARESEHYRTDKLVDFLTTHPTDCRILFYADGKKNLSADDRPSGRDKTEIHAAIAKFIFTMDIHYADAYAEDPGKFGVAVGNRIDT